jgi:pectate lyase
MGGTEGRCLMSLLLRRSVPQSGAANAYSRARLLAKANGFAETTTGGGLEGAGVTVTTDAATGAGSLHEYAGQTDALWIRPSAEMIGDGGVVISPATAIPLQPDKTLDFLGSGVTLSGKGLSLAMNNAPLGHQAAANIIIQGLKFDGIIGNNADGLGIAGRSDRPADNVWIRYCTFTDIHDGLIDITAPPLNGALQRATIEWCKFGPSPGAACIAEEGPINWNNIPDNDGRNGKGNLWADGASNANAYTTPAASLGITPTELAFRKRVTAHHNLFTGLLQRQPFLRNVRAHLYNNLVDGWGWPYENGQPKGTATELNYYTDVLVHNCIYRQWAVGTPHPADGTLVTHPAVNALYWQTAFTGVAYMKLDHSGVAYTAGSIVRAPQNASTVHVPTYTYTLDPSTAGTDLGTADNVALIAKILAGAGQR